MTQEPTTEELIDTDVGLLLDCLDQKYDDADDNKVSHINISKDTVLECSNCIRRLAGENHVMRSALSVLSKLNWIPPIGVEREPYYRRVMHNVEKISRHAISPTTPNDTKETV